MKRLLGIAVFLTVLVAATMLLFTGCAGQTESSHASPDPLPPPPVTTAKVNEGTLFIRCSEPEGNTFSIQFAGVVPTNYIDYAGFEACIVYPDGTRGSRQTVKLYTLHQSIEDEEGNVEIVPGDFGEEYKDGYVFVRALDRIPVTNDTLSYEIAAYYVVNNKKYYTAKQIFSLHDLLEEHININPEPLTVKDTSDIVEVQRWEEFENTHQHEDPTLSSKYFIGASLPDDNGNVDMYACFAVPTARVTTVGIRYNFTQKSGAYAGVSTTLSRAKATELYNTVITETETLTIEDFGLTQGYLAVIPINQGVNTVTLQNFKMNLEIFFSRNAVETTLIDVKFDFSHIVDRCIVTREGVPIATYTYIPNDFKPWTDFGEAFDNAVGKGHLKLRVSDAVNLNGQYKFRMQLAAAIPTRFADRVAFSYEYYDKDGNLIGLPNRDIPVTDSEILDEHGEKLITEVYRTIFTDDNDGAITPKDFGLDRGYIMSTTLSNIDFDGEIASIKISAYYQKDGKKTEVISQTVSLDTLRQMIEKID